MPTLRPLRSTDAEAVLEAFTAHPDMARQGDVTTLDQAAAYIDGFQDDLHHAFAVTDDDHLIGLVAITVDHRNSSGWFFYWLHPAHWGRGLTSAAAAAVANWALNAGGLDRLELGHRANNPASGAVARAAGFILEGTERAKFLIDGERIDVHFYGRLRTDPWPASTVPLTVP